MLILLGLFAAIALLLTAAGIYGTMVYLLSQRRREIGIRLALGAPDSALLRDAVVRQMKYVAVGLACGVGLSVAAARFASASVFSSSGSDPAAYAAAPLVVLAVGIAANYYPVKRTLRSAPYDVLRQQ